jgi:hypothetical protein
MSGYAVTIFTVILSRFLAIFRSKREEKKSSSKFFEALDKKFDSELVKDQSDIEILKSAIERELQCVTQFDMMIRGPCHLT